MFFHQHYPKNLSQALRCHIVLNNYRPSEYSVLWQQMHSVQFEIEIEIEKACSCPESTFWDMEIIIQQEHFPLKKSHNRAELNLTLVFPSQHTHTHTHTHTQNNWRVYFNPGALPSFLWRSIISQFISMTSGPSSAELCVWLFTNSADMSSCVWQLTPGNIPTNPQPPDLTPLTVRQ